MQLSPSVPNMPPQHEEALLYGAKEPPLWEITIGQLIRDKASQYHDRTAVIIPWQGFRSTYGELLTRCRRVSRALLRHGLRHGDCIGVMAGNRYEYIDIFLGATNIGCPVVLLNNTYSPVELLNATKQTCKIVFIAASIGQLSLQEHVTALCTQQSDAREDALQTICLLDREKDTRRQDSVHYQEFLQGNGDKVPDEVLASAEKKVGPDDVINLHHRSTQGCYAHENLVNNARFVGEGMQIRPQDILCCPPPLFHCFGMVLGVLTAFSHGIPILLPSDSFNAERTMDAVHNEKATILHGVPTMFLAELQAVASTGRKPTSLRMCFGAGSAVTMSLVKQLNENMGVKDVLIGYGMTETSPISFMTLPSDSLDRKLSSIGRPIPHVGAKVIDSKGHVLHRGQRGELCTTGFGLQKGYLNNPEKTSEAMRKDENGILWMHTGDEVLIDEEGYGYITGRIKDMIIRGK
ncbi:AMP-binding enzyme domain-containing protein [Sarocladium implicatum]|nr:AMP-binding enzyme domain-containing protein [Sarocladium implicatum]